MRPPGARSWWIIQRVCTASRPREEIAMKGSSITVAALLVTGFTILGCSSSPSGQGDTGWTTLFDGSSLDNWNQIGSAIFLRCADPQKVTAANCYEVNIYDKRPEPSYGTGAIVDVAKVVPMPKAGGQWNIYEITARGPHLVVTLNGTRTVDVLDYKLSRGPIALQYGAGVVKFRKVEIKPL